MTKGHVVLILSLGTLALSRPVVADSLEVKLQPAQPRFSSSAEVKLWATLVNSGPGCTPLFVDPVFSTSPSPVRPQSLLNLTIHDKSGRRIAPRSLTEADATTLRLHELLLLPCGTSYGYEIVLTQIPWSYELAPGSYMARVRARIPIASFLKNRDGMKGRLESLWEGISIRSWIRDAEGRSPEVEFTISGSR
jgi:hypothetical protein